MKHPGKNRHQFIHRVHLQSAAHYRQPNRADKSPPQQIDETKNTAMHARDLDRLSSTGIIRIASWQGPDAMHMIRPPRVDVKWAPRPYLPDGVAEGVDLLNQQATAAIVWHQYSAPENAMWRKALRFSALRP